jgi:glucosamine-6-phosphate deaminase
VGRLVELDQTSIEANREWFGGKYAPGLGVTTGMELILAAKRILLLAFGSTKAPAVRAMLEGSPMPDCPASLLQIHRNVLYVLDEAAAANVKHKVPAAQRT